MTVGDLIKELEKVPPWHIMAVIDERTLLPAQNYRLFSVDPDVKMTFSGIDTGFTNPKKIEHLDQD